MLLEFRLIFVCTFSQHLRKHLSNNTVVQYKAIQTEMVRRSAVWFSVVSPVCHTLCLCCVSECVESTWRFGCIIRTLCLCYWQQEKNNKTLIITHLHTHTHIKDIYIYKHYMNKQSNKKEPQTLIHRWRQPELKAYCCCHCWSWRWCCCCCWCFCC